MSAEQIDFIQHFTSAQPVLRRYVFAQVPNFHQAEDTLQEIATRLWTKFDQFEKDKDFTRWALGVARYEILHSRRSVSRGRLIFTDEMQDVLVERVENMQPEFDARRAALGGCREKLQDKQRQILAMKYESSASCDQIATRLSISVNSVRINLCRIRQVLADCVSRAMRATDERATREEEVSA